MYIVVAGYFVKQILKKLGLVQSLIDMDGILIYNLLYLYALPTGVDKFM